MSKFDDKYMQMAAIWATNSYCKRRQVGALLVKDRMIISDGYLFLRGRSKCMVLGPSGQNIYPEELEATINNFAYVVDSLVVEDDGGLTALIYPDWHQGDLDGMTRSEFKKRIMDMLPVINQELPGYAQIKKIELMPEDFERTPKRSIKRYLYQRQK